MYQKARGGGESWRALGFRRITANSCVLRLTFGQEGQGIMCSCNCPILASEPKHAGDERRCSEDPCLSTWNKNKERTEAYNASVILKTGHASCVLSNVSLQNAEKYPVMETLLWFKLKLNMNHRSWGLLGPLFSALTFILQFPAVTKNSAANGIPSPMKPKKCWSSWQQVADFQEQETPQKRHCLVLRI